MAFMALFGWIVLLMIPAFYIGMALEAVLTWAAAHVLLRAGLGVFCRHCLFSDFDFSAYPPLGGSVAVNLIFAYKENNEWILNIGIYRAYFW